MSDQAAFMAKIIERIDDDAPRLVMADWLEEHGQGERAEFIRLQCESAKFPRGLAAIPVSAANIARRLAAKADNALSERERMFVRWDALRRRERELQPASDDRRFIPEDWPLVWCNGPEESVVGWGWSRGFVIYIACPAADWLAHGDALTWRPGWTDECPKCGGVPGRPMWRCTNCDGGRVPRPCPEGAQPVERVRLTTVPELDVGGWDERGPHVSRGIRFLIAGEWVEAPSYDEWRYPDRMPGRTPEWNAEMMRRRWPGIEFKLPADNPPAQHPPRSSSTRS